MINGAGHGPPAAAAARITVTGAVQGAGFRPFAWRLANALGLAGWIRNTGEGVVVHVEGDAAALAAFTERLQREAPPAARPRSVTVKADVAEGLRAFAIARSESSAAPSVAMLPDLATCDDCRHELFDPTDRRFRYVFLNCTACGPRLSITESLPYDRHRTVMRDFALCGACAAEYGDPADRRFHAQPIACPACGPHLWFEGPRGAGISALAAAAALVGRGGIVAIRGLGGYQLVCDAGDAAAVQRLRDRKGRGGKPFAVMYPSLAMLKKDARLTAAEEALLASAAAPIVLLRRRPRAAPCDAVAPGLTTIGAMLPYSPLHHLLLAVLDYPVVMTSGNLAEEPMVTVAEDARRHLGAVADGFLHHDRGIARPVDDSVTRVIEGAPVVMRRARGFAPAPLAQRAELPVVRALGSHLKNAPAWSFGNTILVSQHIGDLEHPRSIAAHERAVRDYERLYHLVPVAAACDLHPDYATTHLAEESGLPVIGVQHHHAHVASAMAEHDLDGEVLGMAWDGTGFGPDGTVWGGEFLLASRTSFRRVARLAPFLLPGGDAAAREPWRSALGVLHHAIGSSLWDRDLPPVRRAAPDAAVLAPMLNTGACAAWTSSAGRLFDAVAALLGLQLESGYEGEAALRLEQAARAGAPAYPFTLVERPAPAEPPLEVDWRPTFVALLDDLAHARSRQRVAGRWHATLAAMAGSVAEWAGLPRVVLSGGCFQNALLTHLVSERLSQAGLEVITHRTIPPNDGGLAVGQALVAAHLLLAAGV